MRVIGVNTEVTEERPEATERFLSIRGMPVHTGDLFFNLKTNSKCTRIDKMRGAFSVASGRPSVTSVSTNTCD